jgi:outer membrane protein assembly factor BamA
VGVDYRRVDLLELARVEDPDRDLLDIEIASVIGRVTVDRRDDPLDPTRGGSTSVVVQQAFPLWNAEEEFLKVFAQQTFHLPLDRFGTLAASLRVGGIEPADSDREIPIAERLYAGGRTTHRAFPRDRLGILGSTLDAEGAPLGGNGLLLVNLDWRFPLFGDVGGIVFADAGNVHPDWRDLDLGELRWGAGVGVRYLSPVGPLRLEIGWPFDPAAIEDDYVVSFSFGNAF